MKRYARERVYTAVAGAEGHHVRLGESGHDGEVETVEGLAARQPSFAEAALEAAPGAVGDFVFGQGGQQAGSRPAFAVGLCGELRPQRFYYVSPTVFPEVYVNTFGVGAPLAGVPVYAVLDLFVDIEHDRFWWWHGAALTASLLVALVALFVFLAAHGFVQPVPAVLIALAFGLGSCAWPVSSQALYKGLLCRWAAGRGNEFEADRHPERWRRVGAHRGRRGP